MAIPNTGSAGSFAGWYIGRIDIASVASAKAGSSTAVTDTVFQWSDATTGPTVATANITGLTAIVGGPYATESAAMAAASADPNTNNGLGGPAPAPTVSTVNSSNGHLPSIPNPLSGLAAIGDFFGRLTEASTWIRVGEVLLGGALIIIALAKLAADTPAGKAAMKIGKAAAIL